MTYSVEIAAQAEQDLRGIFEYIAYELQSVQNAPSTGCRSGIAGMKRSHGIAGAGGLCR